MLPIARSARSKKRMRPKMKKKKPGRSSAYCLLVLFGIAHLPPVQNATPISTSQSVLYHVAARCAYSASLITSRKACLLLYMRSPQASMARQGESSLVSAPMLRKCCLTRAVLRNISSNFRVEASCRVAISAGTKSLPFALINTTHKHLCEAYHDTEMRD